MNIDPSMWSALQTFLVIELKISDSKQSLQALKSRYIGLCKFLNGSPLTRESFTQFLSYMKDFEYAPSYMNGFVTLAKYLGKYSKSEEFEDYTYFPVARHFPRTIITPEEIKQLATVQIPYQKMSDTINARQQAIIFLLGTTGCRISEALGLTWDDVIEDPCSVLFRNTKNYTDRQVPIARELYQLLMMQPRTSPYVFTSGRGGKVDAPQINLDLKRRADACGITKEVWCHLFRHSYISTMFNIGVDISDIGHIVGHQDPKSTLRYKHSLLTHYEGITMMHPLRKEGLTLDILGKKIKDLIDKLVDTNKYALRFDTDSDAITIKIKKGNYES